MIFWIFFENIMTFLNRADDEDDRDSGHNSNASGNVEWIFDDDAASDTTVSTVDGMPETWTPPPPTAILAGSAVVLD